MSQLSNFAENKLVDMIRGQAWTLPADLEFGLASAWSDSSVTEASGTGYARVSVTRALANWSGTQGAGTTLASTGTSHESTNNVAIDFGTVGAGGWGADATHLVCFDDADNVIFAAALTAPLDLSADTMISFAAGDVYFRLGLTGGMSDYLANKLIDFILRGESYTYPATTYVAYCTSAPTNANGGGAEPAVGGYARVALASSLTAMAGTQAAGSTTASSGTSGETSNNATITFPTRSADQGTATHRKIMDASTVGNLLFWAALDTPRALPSGGAAFYYQPGGLKIRFA